MELTHDQYFGLSKMEKWYRKYSKQFIEISGTVGTGVWELLEEFINNTEINPREVVYLSFDQKRVHELAQEGYHCYYIYSAIYKHRKIIDIDTIPILNTKPVQMEYYWERTVKKRFPFDYKMMVIIDSLLLTETLIKDLSTFGLPIVLLRDPMLLPSVDSITFLRNPDVQLNERTDRGLVTPLVHFAYKPLHKERLPYGSFNAVNIVPKKRLSIYNLRSADMILTLTETFRDELNSLYRSKVLNANDSRIITNERVICDSTHWREVITNDKNKRIKIFLTNGIIGHLTKVNRHALSTKYINVDFTPEFYHEPFYSLDINRYYPNNIDYESKQQLPDDIVLFQYAYVLSVMRGRHTFWDNVTLIIEDTSLFDDEMYQRILYTGITRARKSLTIIV